MMYAYTSPRYQVNVYRTIGPLVFGINMFSQDSYELSAFYKHTELKVGSYFLAKN